MNASSEPRRCPACSAEIPAEAPQGLCPKCLLLGVASVAEPLGNSEGFAAGATLQSGVRAPSRAANDSRPAPPSIDELAAAFPQLEIIELIGRGGMGFVYKARQPKLDRFVALKILPGHLASEPSFHERFEREARVLAKLQHPLIVSVYDFGEATTVVQSLRRLDAESRSDSATAERAVGWDQRRFAAPAHHDVSTRPDGGPALEASLSHPTNTTNAPDARSYFYLMLEYVDGVNLREAMRAGRFTPDQALAIVPQVCEALQYAHSKGVLHRDIKPENILLDTDGRVKIADFGIAKVLGPETDESSSHFAPGGASESERAVTRLTATGSVLGTPLYMAPEQLFNPNSVDHRADIFSLGVVFYEMLTGELPMGRFAPPSEKSLANQQIDQRIDEVVLRALAKERELRQQSAGELKTEVETISSTPRHSPAPPPVPATAPSRQTSNSSSGDRLDRAVAPNTSASGGWWALASLFIGTPLAMLPMIGFSKSVATTLRPPPPSPAWFAFMVALMILIMVGGTLGPIWLGWSHLIRQHRDRSRNGIIPAMIAAYFLPLLILSIVLFWLVHMPLDSLRQHAHPRTFAIATLVAHYLGGTLCLLVDGMILAATWHWVTGTPSWWSRSASEGVPSESHHMGRRIIGAGLVLLSVCFTLGWWIYVWDENRVYHNQWENAVAKTRFEKNAVQEALTAANTALYEHEHAGHVNGRGPAVETAQHAEERRKLADERTRLSREGQKLETDLFIITTTQNVRDGLETFFPVSLFALPFTVIGILLMTRRYRVAWGTSAIIGSLAIEFIVVQMLTERWVSTSMGTKTAVASSPSSSMENHGDEPDGTSVNTATPSGTARVHESPTRNDKNVRPLSAAEAEAKRLGLIRVVDELSEVYVVQQPIGLKGDTGEVFVEPHFSALVRLPNSTNRLSLSLKEKSPLQANAGERFNRVWTVAYPCDYMACDWTAGTDNPHFMGYVLPPGAYDFRADAETSKLLAAVDSAIRARVAADTLRLIAEAASKLAATESDWQQATQAAHLRFKFVPKTLSKLNVPDECLIVLTDDSRTLFTREGGRFTKHELAAAEPIRELRNGIGKAVSANLEADVKRLLDKAHRAVKQQNWEELLTCFTDDGRDEWIFEITTGSSLAMTMLEKQGGVAVLKSIPQMATLIQLGDELKRLSRKPTTEEGKLLDQRYQNYSKLSAADRRQLRIDVMRANYPDLARVATTTLTFVRQLDEQKLIVDFSAINDLHVEGDRATGTWSTTDGKLNPIVMRRVEVNGKHIWKIDSLIGKSVMDPPFAVSGFPAELMLEVGEPDDPDAQAVAPADATAPENAAGEEGFDES